MVLAISILGLLQLLLPAGVLWGSAAVLASGVGAGAVLLAHDGRRPGALGFYLRLAALPESMKGLALGVLIGLSVVAVLALVGGVRWVAEAGTLTDWLTGGLGALAFLAIPAAAEEAVLRGYPLQALAEAWGPAWGLAITSISFGALHAWNPQVTPLALANVSAAGLMLGVVYLKTGSLWWATGAHAGWNWAHGYLSDVPVSGLELIDAPLYDGLARGPQWLGGGPFGPEGSVVATAILLLASVLCWRSRRLRPSAEALGANPLTLVEPWPDGNGRAKSDA
jgi:membrane protease YdiL (CAAX protease family)